MPPEKSLPERIPERNRVYRFIGCERVIGSEDTLQAQARQLLYLVPVGTGRAVLAVGTEPVDIVLTIERRLGRLARHCISRTTRRRSQRNQTRRDFGGSSGRDCLACSYRISSRMVLT